MHKRSSLLLSLLLLAAGGAAAESDDATITYREESMKASSSHLKALKAALAGALPVETQLPFHARALEEMGRSIPAMFPKGSDFGETDAKGEIWEKWDDFLKAAKGLETSAGGLAKALEGGDPSAAAAAAQEVGKACKGCHDLFREKR